MFRMMVIFLILPGVSYGSKSGPLPSQIPVPNNTKILSSIPEKTIKIGSWVSYQIRDLRKNKKYSIRIAFVGREDAGRKTWIEVTLKGIGKTIYLKMLFKGKPGQQMGDPEETIVKFGKMYAMRLPTAKHPDSIVPVLFRKPLKKPKVVGKMDVRTSAGIFPGALKVKGVDADGNIVEMYHHKNVKLWGMLKFSDSKFEMELTGQGLGARSRINEKPAPFMMPR
ncbi:MAG: hypothetical protein JXR95_15635 [Deltaproteobacteria bacterium]|nr:hypothetical protein [Deltaproteobacteria bacterium]